MVLVYHDFYHRRILGRFRFSCTNFNDHLKRQSYRSASRACVRACVRVCVCVCVCVIQSNIQFEQNKVAGIKKI